MKNFYRSFCKVWQKTKPVDLEWPLSLLVLILAGWSGIRKMGRSRVAFFPFISLFSESVKEWGKVLFIEMLCFLLGDSLPNFVSLVMLTSLFLNYLFYLILTHIWNNNWPLLSIWRWVRMIMRRISLSHPFPHSPTDAWTLPSRSECHIIAISEH